MNGANVLIRSEKIPQKHKIVIAWGIVGVVFVITVFSFFADYRYYKKGQEFGLATAAVVSKMSNYGWIDEKSSYEDACEEVYRHLAAWGQAEIRVAFCKIMKDEGYGRYSQLDVADWFKYTNCRQYYIEYYAFKVLPIIFYLSIIVTFIFTVVTLNESKKELIVLEESVICKKNSKKSKQLIFGDINSIDVGKNMLKLVGVGIRFKISNIKNADEINSILIFKKNSATSVKNEQVSINSADELIKYKELLNQEIISQEEFDAKKKQLLGL